MDNDDGGLRHRRGEAGAGVQVGRRLVPRQSSRASRGDDYFVQLTFVQFSLLGVIMLLAHTTGAKNSLHLERLMPLNSRRTSL